mgnify:FL=1
MKNLPRLKSDTKLTSGEWLLIDTDNGLWNVVAFPTGGELIEGTNKKIADISDKRWDIKTTRIIDTKSALDMGLITIEGDNYRLSEISMENIKKFVNKVKGRNK